MDASVGSTSVGDNVPLVVGIATVEVIIVALISQKSPSKPSSQMQRPNRHSFPF